MAGKKLAIILTAVFLALAIYFFLYQASGQEQNEGMASYYTKAFCSRSLCEDIEVYCRAGEVVNIVPTGFTIQNSRGIQNAEEELCG
jgi:hypothetical protein